MSALDHLTVAELEQVHARASEKAEQAVEKGLAAVRTFAARDDLAGLLWGELKKAFERHVRRAWEVADEAEADVSEIALRYEQVAVNRPDRPSCRRGRGIRFGDTWS